MIGAVRDWLTSIVLVSMLVSVAQAMIPEGAIRKIASFTSGLILLVALLRPLLGVDLGRLELGLEGYRDAIEERQEELSAAADAEMAAIIEKQTAAYISDKADALGLTVTVRVSVKLGPEGVAVPWSAEVRGQHSEELAAYMERELGIPEERQVWIDAES